jgi:hypothetical protein
MNRSYDTAAGVRIHGRAAGTGHKAKGLRWSIWFVGVAVAMVVLFKFLPDSLAWLWSSHKTAPVHSTNGFPAGWMPNGQHPPPGTPSAVPTPVPPNRTPAQEDSDGGFGHKLGREVFLTGIVPWGVSFSSSSSKTALKTEDEDETEPNLA